jgi:hypothetical protein
MLTLTTETLTRSVKTSKKNLNGIELTKKYAFVSLAAETLTGINYGGTTSF